jgi:hypothetical protein
MAIRLELGKDVPKDDQKAAGNGDNRFSRDEALGKPIEFSFPIGVKIHGRPGGFDQGGAKVASAGFRYATLTEGLAGGMNTGAKTRVADQLLGGFKTGDIADGGEYGEAKIDAKSGNLKNEGHGIPPVGGITQTRDLRIKLGDLRFEAVKEFQGMAKEDLIGVREGNGIPQGKVLVRERYAWGQLEHVSVKETVKAVTGHGLDPDQAASMSQKAASFADMGGGNPHLGNEAGGAELGELDGIVLVGLDA